MQILICVKAIKICIFFIALDLDKYDIRPDAALQLDKVMMVLNNNPNKVVELRAYTDCRASEAYNQVLSDKSARASAAYMKSRILNPKRITSNSYGEKNQVNERSVTSDCTDQEYQENRRTEIIRKVNSIKGKLIGEK